MQYASKTDCSLSSKLCCFSFRTFSARSIRELHICCHPSAMLELRGSSESIGEGDVSDIVKHDEELSEYVPYMIRFSASRRAEVS